MSALSVVDPTSYSNADKVIVTNIDLVLTIDFPSHTLQGHVSLSLDKLVEGTDTVVTYFLLKISIYIGI